MKQFGHQFSKLVTQALASVSTCLCLSTPAMAGASAERLYVCQGGEYSNELITSPTPCSDPRRYVGDRVTVTIRVEDTDVGNPGAFYIGILKDGNAYGQFVTGAGGPKSPSIVPPAPPAPGVGTPVQVSGGTWTPMHEGLYDPAEYFLSMDGSPRQYLVSSDVKICSALEGGRLELWAGYGALDEQRRKMIELYKPRLNPSITIEHLALTYVQSDMSTRKMGWKVLEIDCNANNGSGGSGYGSRSSDSSF